MQFDVSYQGRLTVTLCSEIGMRKDAAGKETLFSFREHRNLCDAWKRCTGTGAEAMLEASPLSLQAVFGDVTATRMMHLRENRSISDGLYALTLKGIGVICWDHLDFPASLSADSPFLFLTGQRSLLSASKKAGIVGTRDAGKEALDFAEGLGVYCAEKGIAVVSGGATGVDSRAQCSAMEAGGETVFVLPYGLDSRGAKNWLERLQGRFLLMSEVMPEYGFSPLNAFQRNRTIYKLSDLAVVVSAHKGRGGSWQGGCEALKKNYSRIFVRHCGDAGNVALHDRGAVWLFAPNLGEFFPKRGEDAKSCDG